MSKDKYIKEIDEYHDILGMQIERLPYDDGAIHEQESVYQDILDYEEDKFEDWSEKDFIDFIKYLEHLTGITTKLKLTS